MVFIVWNVHKVYCTIYSCVLVILISPKRDSHVRETPFDLITLLLYFFKPPPEFNTFCIERVSRLLPSKETSRISPTIAQDDTPYHSFWNILYTSFNQYPPPTAANNKQPQLQTVFFSRSFLRSLIHTLIHSFTMNVEVAVRAAPVTCLIRGWVSLRDRKIKGWLVSVFKWPFLLCGCNLWLGHS